MQLQWKRIWLSRNFTVQSIYGNNCQMQNCYQASEPPSSWKSYLLSFPSCSSTGDTVESVDGRQCRSIRMGMENTPKLLCTNNDRPRACAKWIVEFRCNCKATSRNTCGKNLCSCRKNGVTCVDACGDCRGESFNNSSAETEDDRTGTCLNDLRTFTFDHVNFYRFDMVFMHLIHLT